MFDNFIKYLNTIKYLKPVQIFYILFYKIKFPFIYKKYHPNINYLIPKTYLPLKKISTDDFNSFTFLNKSYKLSEINWINKSVPRLWLYNLHYFDFLNSQIDRNEKREKLQYNIIKDWIKNNNIGKDIAWDPYTTSLRIVNWIKWNIRTSLLKENELISLYNQSIWLSNKIEYHIQANHLFTNSKALIFSGTYFNNKRSINLLKKGYKIFFSELNNQFLKDGGHFELSPMYHSILLEDLLDIVNYTNMNSNLEFKVKSKIIQSFKWLDFMTFNNEISYFNDSVNNNSQSFKELVKYGARLNIFYKKNKKPYFKRLINSGFIVFKNKNLKLIADVGEVGPKYQPGHGHADTLSFELSYLKNKIIVNQGISTYENSEKRFLQRSTKYHSTVEIDSKNSSQVWSSFRVGKRAYPFNFNFIKKVIDLPDIKFICSHNGYSSCNKKLIHTREWNIIKNKLIIEDEIKGIYNNAFSRFYFHPSLKILNKNALILTNNKNVYIQIRASNGFKDMDIEICDSKYSKEFGYEVSNKFAKIKFDKTNKIIFSMKFKNEI